MSRQRPSRSPDPSRSPESELCSYCKLARSLDRTTHRTERFFKLQYSWILWETPSWRLLPDCCKKHMSVPEANTPQGLRCKRAGAAASVGEASALLHSPSAVSVLSQNQSLNRPPAENLAESRPLPPRAGGGWLSRGSFLFSACPPHSYD